MNMMYVLPEILVTLCLFLSCVDSRADDFLCSATDSKINAVQKYDFKTAPGEDALRQRIPSLFKNAAEQYTFLLKSAPASTSLFPRTTKNKTLQSVKMDDWTSGFFPGTLWYLFEGTQDSFWKEHAICYTDALSGLRHFNAHHDVGFMTMSSYGHAWRLVRHPGADQLLRDAGNALGKRFNEKLGLIKSWNRMSYPVIIDNMMNLELLMWCAKNQGNSDLKRKAVSHATQTNRHHFRHNGSAYHIVDYNPKTGKIFQFVAGQGASADAPWARGQGWAIYGFAMMFRETGNPDFLKRAMTCADFCMNHPNMPADGVPYWDYEAPNIPNEERDASAAAVMANGLLMLSSLTPAPQSDTYRAFAVKQLTTLASPEYLADKNTNGGFLLKHSVGAKPQGVEIDVPLNYADYYFLEALLRLQSTTPHTFPEF